MGNELSKGERRRLHRAAADDFKARELAALPVFQAVFGAAGVRTRDVSIKEQPAEVRQRSNERSNSVPLVADGEVLGVTLGRRSESYTFREELEDGIYADLIKDTKTKNTIYVPGDFHRDLARPWVRRTESRIGNSTKLSVSRMGPDRLYMAILEQSVYFDYLGMVATSLGVQYDPSILKNPASRLPS